MHELSITESIAATVAERLGERRAPWYEWLRGQMLRGARAE